MAAMPKDLFCIPTAKTAVPAGPDWIHELKYDGDRLRVERNGDRVRLLSKSGLDWTKRYPWIVETARKIRKSRFILDGEAVVLGVCQSALKYCKPNDRKAQEAFPVSERGHGGGKSNTDAGFKTIRSPWFRQVRLSTG
jgi:hypothetical protein